MKEISYYHECSPMYNSRYRGLFIWPDQKQRLEDIKPTVTKLKEGDKVFFTNHIDYPRFKFREWASERGISISRSPKNASVIIYDPTYIKSVLDKATPETICKAHINKLVLSNGWSTDDDIIIEDTVVYWDKPHSVLDKYPKIEVDVYLLPIYNKDQSALEQLDILNTSYLTQGTDLITYEDFYSQVSSNLNMTEDIFWTIYDMLANDDAESTELAAEMMTNFNPDTSKFMLDLLMVSFGNKVQASNVYNKVTFKPVLHVLSDLYWARAKSGSGTPARKFMSYTYSFERFLKFYSQYYPELVPTEFVKNWYRSILNNNEEIGEKLQTVIDYYKLVGIKITKLEFDLDPEIFPKQTVNYLNEQEEPNSGSHLGENLHESIEEDLSEYSDQPVGVSKQGQYEGGSDESE